MSGRPSLIRQRDAKQILKAAKQAGAKRVEIKLEDGAVVVVHLDVEDEQGGAEGGQIDL